MNRTANAWRICGVLAMFLACGAALPAQVKTSQRNQSAQGGPGIPQTTATPANAQQPTGPATPPSNGPALALEAQAWLSDLIKINTSNPPGGEDPAAGSEPTASERK